MKHKLNGFDRYRQKLFNEDEDDITDNEVNYLIKQLTHFITKKKKIDKTRLRINIKNNEIIIVTSEKWTAHKIAEIEDITHTHCTTKDGGYYRFLFLREEDLCKFHPRRRLDMSQLQDSLQKIQKKVVILSYKDTAMSKELNAMNEKILYLIDKVNELDISDGDINTLNEIIEKLNQLDNDKADKNDVFVLQEALNNKADLNHTHTTNQIVDLDVSDFDVNLLLDNLTNNVRQI